jgi:predicted amidophosphoribosyltransferase
MARAVVLLKHEPIAALADWFDDRLAEVFRRDVAPYRVDLLVPLPLHVDRQRERGQNQARLIARRCRNGSS